MYKAPEFHIDIPDDAWVPNDALGDPRNRLLVQLVVNGCSMHLEAWEVSYDEERNLQFLVDGGEELDGLAGAVGADGSFTTVEIKGREYVLVASPYC